MPASPLEPRLASRCSTSALSARSMQSPNSTTRARSPAARKRTFIDSPGKVAARFKGGSMAKAINLNADMGEGFGAYDIGDDAGLLKVIRSASIACGFHAGD